MLTYHDTPNFNVVPNILKRNKYYSKPGLGPWAWAFATFKPGPKPTQALCQGWAGLGSNGPGFGL